MLIQFLKKIIPAPALKFFRPFYHGAVAVLASWYFGRPSKKMIVVGVTGTAGKSTTVQMIARILNVSGKKCGFITTVSFSNGDSELINKHGLSMPGGWLLQKQLRIMADNGCKYAVVECTSEGLEQNRHLGIKFDSAVLTNLSEAHIQAHGSFENYRAAKGKLFRGLSDKGLGLRILNANDKNVEYFLQSSTGDKIGVSFRSLNGNGFKKIYQAKQIQDGFNLEGIDFQIKLPGQFNQYNALMAAAVANSLGASLIDCAKAISGFTKIRGRMEEVENNLGFKIFVDYACEPATIRAALLAANGINHARVIHVFGTTGGHRDASKRFIFGQASAELADVSILTNDDVYNSDQQEIINNMRQGFDSVSAGERKAKEVYEIPDRLTAIKKALSLAQKNDIILITGKGSEQFLVLPGNKRIEWDETEVVKQLLQNFPTSH